MSEPNFIPDSSAMVAAFGAGEPLTMSSREIADLCEKRHDHVLRDIRAYVGAVLQMERGIDVRSLDWSGKEGVQLFGETPIGGVSATTEINPQNGQQYPVYHLDKSATLTVVSGYNVILRKRIIDRWLALEGAAPDPMKVLSDPAAMRGLLLTYTEKVIALEGEVAEMRPQVQALERIAVSDGSLCITDAAKTLQVRPKSLFAFLRSHRWVYSRMGSGEIAYQDKLASGLLEHKTTTVYRSDGSEKTATQVRVTPKGLTRLAREFPSIGRAVA